MADWMIWMAVAGLLVVLEMASGTFYLLMVAIGVAAGGVAALAGAGGTTQGLVAAAVGAAATFALRRSRFGLAGKLDSTRDPGVNLDIGESVLVTSWQQAEGARPTARVMYRGAMWDIELAAGAVAQEGSFVIQEVRGNRLIVANRHSS